VGSRHRAKSGSYVRRAPKLSPTLPDGGAAESSDVVTLPVVTLPGDRRRVLVEEAPSEGEVLSPLKLLLKMTLLS